MENKQEKAPQMTSIERNTLSKIIEKHIAIIEDKKTKHGNKNIPKQKTQLVRMFILLIIVNSSYSKRKGLYDFKFLVHFLYICL